MSEHEYESKEQFLEEVREEGAVLNEVEFFTTGEGQSTSYKKRSDEGDVEDVTKAEVEAAWEEVHDDSEEEEQDADEVDEPEQIHLGTFYYSKSNWDDDQHLADLEDVLTDLGWEITGEVESGGYRIGTVDQ